LGETFLKTLRVLPFLFVAATAPAIAETVTDFTLPNGLQVVVIEDHRAPVVTQMIWYRVGAADEPIGHSGIAHFLEHLMFQGTEKVAAGDFSATVERQGGDDNAFTSWDYTSYFQRIATDRLDLMMEMEADRMRNLRLTEDDVTTEREVILSERSQVTDSSPGALLNEQTRAAMFLNHPYGIPIIGWRHEMAALTRDDAYAMYAKFYAPNNATLVIAGDVDPANVRALAEKHYGPLTPSEGIGPRVRAMEPPALAERRVILKDPRVSEPYVIRSYLAPIRKSGDQSEAAALAVLAELLGGSGTTSELARALQFDTQKAVYSSAFYDGTAVDYATFGLVVMPAPDVSLQEAEDAMDKVLADFIVKGPDAEAFARIKTQVRASQIFARDDVGGLAREYGAALTVGLTVDDVETWPDALQAVTVQDVVAAAKAVFDRKASVTGWLMRDEEAAQ
jgi:zinc protease